MKRAFILLFAVLPLVFASVVSAQTIELTYWTHTDDNRTAIENRYIEEFQKLYPNVVDQAGGQRGGQDGRSGSHRLFGTERSGYLQSAH
ncbi:MAG: hypothetical protein ACOX5D_12050 [Limnochordia bacterium]